MDYRRLGNSGLEVSLLSLGTWITFGGIIGRGAVRELVGCAFDAGINLFHSSESHAQGQAQNLLGDVIADLRLPRDAFCVSSSIGAGAVPDPRPTQRGLSHKHLRDGVDAALKRLHVEYLDLCFCQWPDQATPVEETVTAMDALIHQGKVLYWGTSGWPVEEIARAIDFARDNGLVAPSAEQSPYHLLHRERVERELAPLLPHPGLAVASSPADRHETKMARIDAFAHSLGAEPAALAMAWCLANPHVATVILECSSVTQFEANLQALEWVEKFDAELMAALDAALAATAM
jgi:aryl-alcohol dehydrogenase-like predicted oxidoreductase